MSKEHVIIRHGIFIVNGKYRYKIGTGKAGWPFSTLLHRSQEHVIIRHEIYRYCKLKIPV